MENKKSGMLVVDDETDILKIFREIFEIRGWRVFTAPTGAAALNIIKEEKIKIVLLDIYLPGKSGIDVLKEIKEEWPALPVIMVTALGYKDDLVNKAIRLGASGYVSKGVGIKELFTVIDNILAK